MKNNKQIKLVRNVDNLNVSHINSFETNKFSGYLSSIYGWLAVNMGNVHDYLGMDTEYRYHGTVKVYMIK